MRRDPKVYLGVDRPPKMPLVDVELKRSEDLTQREAKLELLIMHKVKTLSRFDLIDCGVQSPVALHLYKWEVWTRYKSVHELISQI